MGALWIALASAVSTIIVTTQVMSSEFSCGPFCPDLNATMTSCVTICPDKEQDEAPFNLFMMAQRPMGRFRNGTPCWRDDGSGEKGVCCDGEWVLKMVQQTPARAR
ncbi:uncharacterized protein LOC119400892 [Rhipicephalus sanguineus]|uniref:uncharacterized protein LOC119400892 n=1 Tax=Rhipicephalus sanguineus TaxID=34632 RepID=UPI001892FBF5|nr:uncharacterized protein LOC119400892 [Rhipicephalus sanguineus]